ncbi:MAG: DUF192 domain-containing protein [Candidatus Blackburnbacteria bacterium]|nr:DUF192 domain-containing protein [Candidatus Blackburnbacteria bacterium]
MKQILGLYALLVGVLLFVSWSSQNNSLRSLFPGVEKEQATPTPKPPKILKVQRATGGEVDIRIEVAKSEEERRVGLSSRDSLNEDSGMLFAFDKMDVRPSFWMRDTKFALDIIWINDGKITQITANVPTVVDGTPDNKIQLYLPHDPVDYVLEVNGGASKKWGIKIGDSLKIPAM